MLVILVTKFNPFEVMAELHGLVKMVFLREYIYCVEMMATQLYVRSIWVYHKGWYFVLYFSFSTLIFILNTRVSKIRGSVRNRLK